ncbi:LuxR family transcriptional regulator [Tsuneonella dongtanensis]|uniref:LuxR family transcriptional regulator n=1 Tax=Tsuneonella dongtanensis TaxID=692370 RepID=UPI0018DE1EFB|nr:LuxR family transcriptional regulator [Tsuneonella dongtanensis]
MSAISGRRFLTALAMMLAMLLGAPGLLAQDRMPQLEIVVPGSPGGGFDKNAQALARVLRSEGLVDKIDIRYSPGAGGLIALAQFVGEPAPDVPTIFIGGTTILGAAAQNRSVVSLDDLAPIAQLNRIGLIIVTRRDGPVDSLAELLTLMRNKTERIEWVGGSPGSKDEMLLIALAKKLGLPRERFTFIGNPGGGGVVGERLLDGHHLVAATSFEEFEAFANRDKFRILAVSSATAIPGVDAPTLRDGGIDLAMDDWKGVFASRKASPDELAQLRVLVAAALASPAWRAELVRHGWAAPAQPEAFAQIIEAGKREAEDLASYTVPNRRSDSAVREILDGPWRYFLYAISVALVLMLIALFEERKARRRKHEVLAKEQELEAIRDRTAEQASGERTEISRQLGEWGLSTAEIDIAWMILKGLQFKEIAGARGTSERTVRQQAQTIYAKSGMANRTEFAAHFLESYRF